MQLVLTCAYKCTQVIYKSRLWWGNSSSRRPTEGTLWEPWSADTRVNLACSHSATPWKTFPRGDFTWASPSHAPRQQPLQCHIFQRHCLCTNRAPLQAGRQVYTSVCLTKVGSLLPEAAWEWIWCTKKGKKKKLGRTLRETRQDEL